MILADKKGRLFRVTAYRPEDEPFLKGMYDEFTPKARFQGMPPEDRMVRCRWVDRLVNDGRNFLAWHEGRVVGHVVIIPDFGMEDSEYLIFVDKNHRGAGVGKEIGRAHV